MQTSILVKVDLLIASLSGLSAQTDPAQLQRTSKCFTVSISLSHTGQRGEELHFQTQRALLVGKCRLSVTTII